MTAAFAIALFLLQPSQVAADTFVSGDLPANTTWTLAQSPIVVTASVYVPPGITLTIQPGVVVRFEAGQGLFVYGTLIARGTATAKIRLTSTQATVTAGFWSEVYFGESSADATYDSSGNWTGGSALEHVIAEGGGYSGSRGTIEIRDSRPLIDSVLIRTGLRSGISAFIDAPPGTMRIRNSEVIGSPSAAPYEWGIDLRYRGSVAIEGNVVHGWGLGGIVVGPYFNDLPSEVLIARNTAYDNGNYGIGVGSDSSTTRFRVLDNIARNNDSGLSVSISGNGTLEVTGNVVQNNRKRGVSVDGPYDFASPTITVSHNIIANNGPDIASLSGGGLHLQSHGTTIVSQNVFSSNTDVSSTVSGSGAYFFVRKSNLTFSHNLVHDNVTYGWTSGVDIQTDGASTVTILGNTVTRNVTTYSGETDLIRPGAFMVGAHYDSTGSIAVHGNNFFGNATRLPLNRYSFYSDAWNLPTVDATGNWWGTTDPGVIQTLIAPRPGETPVRALVDAGFPLGSINTDAPISPPTGLLVARAGGTATVSWNANPESDVMGYRVWYGAPGDPSYSGTGAVQGGSPIDVGAATSFQLTGLPANAVVTVTAYDNQRDGVRDQTEGHESWFAPPPAAPLVLTSLTADRSAPMIATNGSVIFTAQATGGRPPYRYKWTVSDVEPWKQGYWTTSNQYWLDASVPHPYRISVEVQSLTNLSDGADNANAAGAMDFRIDPAPLTLSIRSHSPSPQPIDGFFTFYATATGGTTNYQYKWRVSTDGGATYTTAQDWNLFSSFWWTPPGPVTDARIQVWLRDSGTADVPQLQATMPYVVTGPLTLLSLTSNVASPQAPGSTITFTANASGGTPPYQYKWYVFDGASWNVVRNWAVGNTFAWTPATASPAYRVAVWIRNAGSATDMYANANSNGSVGYVIATPPPPLSVTGLTSNAASPQGLGTTITFAATVAGGAAPQQYKWRVSTDGGTTYSTAQDWSTASTFTWTPTSILPNARITLWVRNSGVTADAPQAQATLPFVITAPVLPLALNSITSNVAAPQAPGTTITFTANTSGGSAPHQYKWWVFDGAWRVAQEWTTGNTFAWTPSSVSPVYRIAAWVRNAGSTADMYANANANLSIGYEIAAAVAPLSLTSLTANVASPQTAGTTIAFSAAAGGGTAPYQFKWRVSTDGGANFSTAQDWSAGSTFAWTPGSAIADARVTVWARNTGVVADAPQAQSTMAYVISAAPPSTGPLVLSSITSNVASPQAPGATITFTANASNGTAPYQYKWWVFNGTSWTVVRDWTTGATYAWTPTSPSAAYRVAAWVRNAGSTADVYANANSNLSIGYEIATAGVPLSVTSLTANMASPQAAGTTIAFSATAAGGTAPYQYKWRVSADGGASFTTAQDWSAGSTFAWTPGSAIVDARISVWVRNSGVAADAAQAQATMSYVVTTPAPSTGPLVLNAISSDIPSPQATNTTIWMTASASGGTAPYQYKWWLFNGTTWQVMQDWSTSDRFGWMASVPSDAYRIGVWVRNAGSTVDASANSHANGSAGFVITPSTVPLSVTSLTSNLASPQVTGTAITFTALVTGGSWPHQYKWRVSTDGGASYITAQEWGDSRAFTWTPGTPVFDARVSVWVRSRGVTTDAPQAQSSMPYVISAPAPSTGPLVLSSITSNVASPQPTGATITFTANASGGTAPHQYKWWLFNGTSWIVVRDWTTDNTYAWTPSGASSAYRVGVWVRNAGSTADASANANANASIGFAITP